MPRPIQPNPLRIDMYRMRFILATLILAVITAGPSQAERDVVDKIVAVVGDKVILASEVANQVQLMAFQTGQRPTREEEIRLLQDRVLEQMVSDQLFLLEAKKDTTVVVRREEVDQALDDQIARVASNFGSEAEFLDALSEEGLTLRDLRRRYRSDLENQLLRQRFIQQKLYTVSVSRHEVEQFYREFADSLPGQVEAAKLAHILLEINVSPELEDSVRARATDLRQQVLDGADFATLSARHSTGDFSSEGGDLGWLSPSDVVPEFSRAAFQLQVGEISGVVRTQFGYHVIKCEGKRENESKLRHILLAVTPSAEDTLGAHELADSLLRETRAGGDFAEIAKVFSADDDTRGVGGELGWFSSDQMHPDFIDAVSGWTTPGEIRGPVPTRFGLHILKLLDYQPARQLSLETDFDRIKEMARQDKTGRIVDDWIEEIKERTYIDYRLDE